MRRGLHLAETALSGSLWVAAGLKNPIDGFSGSLMGDGLPEKCWVYQPNLLYCAAPVLACCKMAAVRLWRRASLVLFFISGKGYLKIRLFWYPRGSGVLVEFGKQPVLFHSVEAALSGSLDFGHYRPDRHGLQLPVLHCPAKQLLRFIHCGRRRQFQVAHHLAQQGFFVV